MSRVYNFSAGPAILPEEVLKQVQEELLEYQGTGQSVMEMSHRSKEYLEIYNSAVAGFREVLGIPDEYEVLFTHGGASLQFSMIPLNLMATGSADYINTGVWSKKAIKEAKRFGTVNVIASSEDKNFSYIPDSSAVKLSDNASYLHITGNNTIFGTEYHSLPEHGSVPVISDMSSNILSRVIDVRDYGMIYGGAQKNIGPSGLGFAVINKFLLGHAREDSPVLLDYKTYADNGSMYNTPATFSIYVAKLVFEWIKKQGGLSAVEETNIKKANLLYDYIDGSDFYQGTAEKNSRSRMNVPFLLGDKELEKPFLELAKEAGMINLSGHRSVGGLRASIYNAMPTAGVQALVDFMDNFVKTRA